MFLAESSLAMAVMNSSPRSVAACSIELVIAMKNSASEVLAQAIRLGRSGALPLFSPKTNGCRLSGAGIPGPTSAPGASEPPPLTTPADEAADERRAGGRRRR